MGSDSEKKRGSEITATMELFDARELAELHRIIVSMVSELDSREVIKQLVSGALRVLGGDFCYLLVTDSSKQKLKVARIKGIRDPLDQDLNADKGLEGRLPSMISTGEGLKHSLAGPDPVPESLVYAALRTTDDLEGVLCVGSYEQKFNFRDNRALSLLARPAGLVLQNARLYEESTTLSRQLQTLTDIQRILTTVSLDQAFSSFAETLRRIIGFELALILTYEPGTREYIVTHAWSPEEDKVKGWVQRRVNEDSSFHARLLVNSPGKLIDSLAMSPEGTEKTWLDKEQMQSGLVMPLRSFDMTIGAFSLWSSKPEDFSSSESAFVLGLGRQLALAVENQRLFVRLERAKTEWESTFDSMNDAVWITDVRKCVKRANKAFRNAVDQEYQEVVGSLTHEIIGTEQENLDFKEGQEAEEGRYRREFIGTKLGKVVEVVATKVSFADGGRIVYVGRDVTETKELNVRLQQAGRMAALGQLAAAVAHEINNPLAYIAVNLHRIQQQAEAVEGATLASVSQDITLAPFAALVSELPVLAGESLEGVSRVQGIVEKLQIYARGSKTGRSTFSINDLVGFCLTLVWATLRPRTQVKKHFNELPDYFGDQHSLSQVLVNILIRVARSLDPSMPADNVLHISTEYDSDRWQVSFRAERGGEPVPIENIEPFEPYFAGEQVEFGTASGTELDPQLIQKLGGEVRFMEESGQSTTLILVLRNQRRDSRVSSLPKEKLVERSERSGRILIIDDEPYVRRALRRTLSDVHEIYLARDGADALSILEGTTEPFDVILCDVVMPGMSGLDFFQIFERRWPNLRDTVIFVTGGVFNTEAEKQLRSGPNPVLRKPIQPPDLIKAVQAVLERKHSESSAE